LNRAITFLYTIIRHGKLRHSGHDFRQRRRDLLQEVEELEQWREPRHTLKQWLMKNAYLRMLIGEAAFVKKSLVTRGGHLILNEPSICYVRIPRSASTAVSKSILQTTFPALKEKNLSATQINAIADVYLRTTRSTTCSLTFTVVRNPFARVVSVYREFFERKDTYFIYEDYLFGIFKRHVSFSEFVRTLHVIPDRLKDQHLKPQHLFLKYYEQRNIAVKVLKLEETGAVENFLLSHGIAFAVFNRSQENYDFVQYYDSLTLEAVSDIYKADILRFGYESSLREIKFNIEHRAVHI
jgi:hypothetical protein